MSRDAGTVNLLMNGDIGTVGGCQGSEFILMRDEVVEIKGEEKGGVGRVWLGLQRGDGGAVDWERVREVSLEDRRENLFTAFA